MARSLAHSAQRGPKLEPTVAARQITQAARRRWGAPLEVGHVVGRAAGTAADGDSRAAEREGMTPAACGSDRSAGDWACCPSGLAGRTPTSVHALAPACTRAASFAGGGGGIPDAEGRERCYSGFSVGGAVCTRHTRQAHKRYTRRAPLGRRACITRHERKPRWLCPAAPPYGHNMCT